ncbi:MAG TPA: phosphodiester glycosidase family protein [Tepidisphaeraceae bacterium]|nr:phosphodiester glycosidase family protein [Tepidisphaeraceae bacterium]
MFVGCVALGMGGEAFALEVRTAEPYLGVTEYQYIQTAADTSAGSLPRDVVAEVLEIDVKTAGIQFLMSPGNGTLPGEVTQSTTSAFVNSVGAQIGINGSFFDTNPPYTPTGVYTDLTYVAASQGSVYSPDAGGESLFNITAANVASIETAGAAGSLTAKNGSALYNAIGGNLRILSGGKLVNTGGSYATTLNPHTAIGVSKDGSKVFLMTDDGRQPGFSDGMYTYEMAQILADLGAWNAVNLDGGGSTTMVMDDSNDGKQDARIIDSPSDDSTTTGPGVQRVVGNNMAVFATINPNYVPLPNLAYPGQAGVVPYLMTPAVFDRFEGSAGHFATGALASGSNHNISSASTVSVDTTHAEEGKSSLKVSIVNTNGATKQMQLRLLSGGGTPTANLYNGDSMSSTGYFGFWLMLPTGSSPLYVATMLDDGTTTSNGLEISTFKNVVADGAWHLYQWALFDADSWNNYSGGNGAIGGPDVFLDSIYFSSAAATSGGTNFSGTVWVDGISYNPLGVVPEPGVMGLMGMVMVAGRRRGRRAELRG